MGSSCHAVVASVFTLLLAVSHSVLAKETQEVTCGSVIKLVHEGTKHKLHSHDIAYGSGSGQQSVTGFSGSEDSNSYWIVKGPQDKPCPMGTPVTKGMEIRLMHHSTRKWLHSHSFASPLSNNQEVSAFGAEHQSDQGDIWKVEWDSKSKAWLRDMSVRFLHKATGVGLSSHNKKFGRPISGQTEICGMRRPEKNGLWKATEGVYFPEHQDGDEDEHTEL